MTSSNECGSNSPTRTADINKRIIRKHSGSQKKSPSIEASFSRDDFASRRSSTTAALLKDPSENYGTKGIPPVSIDIDIRNPAPKVIDAVTRHLSSTPNHLQMQGADMTRDLYKWAKEHPSSPPPASSENMLASSGNQFTNISTPNEFTNPNAFKRKRSMSFSAVSAHSSAMNSISNYNTNNDFRQVRNELPEIMMSHEDIRAPGGFRRSYLIQKHIEENGEEPPNNFITRNFIEFLTLYGHFAGEDLSESEEESDIEGEYDEEALETESTRLLSTHRSRKHRPAVHGHKSSTTKAVLLLLKSFVGTGVLFLPRAFHNGGWGFSSSVLLICALISYWCFVLLIDTKNHVGLDGYGDMGNHLYGSSMKLAILWSIALSQIGFSSAYTVFTATNLQVFTNNVFKQEYGITIFIIIQVLFFLPLALTRNIAKLSGTALIADLFILLGLVYVYWFSISHVSTHGVASETMLMFNKADWSLFIGTAIFTFEGIGLLIPIQESMKKPEHFHASLSGVMCVVTVVFISCGLLCYCAFGADVETVVLLNFPQESIYTRAVQLLYALAILLSTPLQLFPAIKILENWTFSPHSSGKHNPKVKWLKNYFRAAIVCFSALIAWAGANDLDKFVSLVGSFACIPLIYIYPPMLHFKAFKKDKSKLFMASDIFLLFFGIIVMIYTSLQTIGMWLN
ncbi:Transmembrane amino acid transporter protein [Nakaseomyces glabratus]|nr:Transmembrane amino acid transporter protein [Nakaseomyces glabratus]KAH7605601.1 Transmembrane amino acid transporter protein [Nakaseomyces glabratus]KAH7614606.1 Transmembrane amino acid transporter protein [Nakaseomyces glabratus]